MTKRIVGIILSLVFAGIANAATITRLVPVFANQVSGLGGSLWQSELRLFNNSLQSQVVSLARLLPAGALSCNGFDPVMLAPGALAQVRSLGCTGSGTAALEVSSDDSVEIDSVITNVGGLPQDPCCLAGFTQNVPVLPTSMAYSLSRTVANLQIPVVGLKNIGRHNLIFVNPNDSSTTVSLQYFLATGARDEPPVFPNSSVTLPPRAYVQVNDVLPQPNVQFTPPTLRGYWRIQASSAMPFYFLDSYVDNVTNDATTIESH
jgi:hypothetical protein